ncbi:MAG: DUF1570 domain-containing protein [Cephaloticoccus sp.]|nr:DUF1570 domain-containing protein [Cephaloticoccus sp.]
MKLPPGREPPTRVVAFRRDKDFDPYKPIFDGKTKELSGYFTGGSDVAFIAIRLGRDQDEARRIIFHEYVHQLLVTHGLNPPLWLNEGLAEFYSTFRMVKGEVVIGTPIETHVTFLNQVRGMGVADLARMGRDSKDYNEGFRQGLFYARSWALVHYMLCGKSKHDLSRALPRFLALQNAGDLSEPERFEKAFGMDYSAMDVELLRYLRGGRFYLYRGELPTKTAAKHFELTAADPVLLECTLTELEWLARKSGDATYRLLTLQENNPAVARVPEALGSIAWRKNDLLAAKDYWQQAAELGSDNPFVLVQGTLGTIHDTMGNGNLNYRFNAGMAAPLRSRLVRALDLCPDYAEAYEGLALLEAFAAEPEIINVNRVQRNTAKIGDLHYTYLALAILRWRMGDFETSRQLVQVLRAAPGKDRVRLRILATLESELQK